MESQMPPENHAIDLNTIQHNLLNIEEMLRTQQEWNDAIALVSMGFVTNERARATLARIVREAEKAFADLNKQWKQTCVSAGIDTDINNPNPEQQ
jgi:hypothetical protein